LKIGIVGTGNVGHAASEGFKARGHEVWVNDVRHIPNNTDKSTMYRGCDLIFICVPTPSLADGNIDLANIRMVLEDFRKLWYKGNKAIFVIKSTVTPGTTRKLEATYPFFKISCNPDFLREEHAVKDFKDPDRIVIGANNSFVMDQVRLAYASWKTTPQIWTDTTTAETIKYLSNIYLIAKVAFSQESKHICELLGVDPKTVLDGVSLDRRINRSHLDPDKGKIPLDSPCLPKDLRAFQSSLVEICGYNSEFLNVIRKLGIEK
jgi:UDPglucose 6-dehydrogenase